MNSQLINPLFEAFFNKHYSERWPLLRTELVKKEKQILRKNLFSFENSDENLESCDFLKNCFWRDENFNLKKNQYGFFNYYIMDPASVIVASALQVQSSDQVLDMCAAPGGKSLILAEQMFFQSSGQQLSGSLISNEMSDGRRERLLRVFHEYIPKEQRMFIHVKGLDGNQYGLRQPEHYDRVLADVPCSGERHLFENPKELGLWTEKRTKNLAIRQFSLLSSAWLATKTGGRIVYSTCSISPEENDAVVAKLIKKRSPEIFRLDYLDELNFLEKTKYGYQILPDRSGFGPMYFSIINKV